MSETFSDDFSDINIDYAQTKNERISEGKSFGAFTTKNIKPTQPIYLQNNTENLNSEPNDTEHDGEDDLGITKHRKESNQDKSSTNDHRNSNLYYNPRDYDSLNVNNETQRLFEYIERFKHNEIELETQLKPFIPDYTPSIGNVDSFIKPTLSTIDCDKQENNEKLGIHYLDEPILNQSEPCNEKDNKNKDTISHNDIELQRTHYNERSEPHPEVYNTEIEMETIADYMIKPLELRHDEQEENLSVLTQKDDDKQNDMESKVKEYTICISNITVSLIFIGVILAIILIPLSMRKIEFDEYALKYNDLTKEVHNEPYSEGRYIFTPQTKLFRYDNIIQTLNLDLECLTKDGILIGINVTIQYSIPENNLNKIWNEYGIEGNLDNYSRLVSSAAIRDGVSTYNVASFYLDRYIIQNKIETYLFDAFEYSNTYLDITSAILTGYSFPQLLKETIRVKRNAENDIQIAKNERDGNITDASTALSIAKIYAKQLLISGEAEHESILAEANQKSKMIKNMFEYRTELMFNVMQRMNMSAIQFIESWLTAHVLLNANNPYTTTL